MIDRFGHHTRFEERETERMIAARVCVRERERGIERSLRIFNVGQTNLKK